MGGRIGLVKGKQTEAAQVIIDHLPQVQRILDSIPKVIEEQAAGFDGNSSGGLTIALADWLTVAGQLPQILAEYARALADVDRLAAAADAQGATTLGSAPGGSGLNLE